ncbi:Cysteine-rich receptor-like protein kinase 1 [Camellia lanceoleosa]|uniref:Cysteine-rich receptor-like protein kinase 1 n=1 Tax=Camellia lanceoleosa TaxID=1840588 RepID=A0ACC0HXN8_9ERIC|nr:Cysteine-rich receptor-like protein kinase 1 [Camellia lanceoleosa]
MGDTDLSPNGYSPSLRRPLSLFFTPTPDVPFNPTPDSSSLSLSFHHSTRTTTKRSRGHEIPRQVEREVPTVGQQLRCYMAPEYLVEDNVWKLYKTNSLGGSVDPRIKEDFPAKEASRVLQRGLLCTQASVDLRPSMAEVVQMLTNIECEIPEPKQPHFPTSSGLNLASSGRSYGINSLISNALTKIKGSCTPTEY